MTVNGSVQSPLAHMLSFSVRVVCVAPLLFCSAIITFIPVSTRPARIKTKHHTLLDLTRPRRFSAALSHRSEAPRLQTSFFFCCGLFSHWSSVLRDSCCDWRALLNLKLLIYCDLQCVRPCVSVFSPRALGCVRAHKNVSHHQLS